MFNKSWNPLKWAPGTVEVFLAFYFIGNMFRYEEGTIEFVSVFILAMLMTGIGTIRKDIHRLKQEKD